MSDEPQPQAEQPQAEAQPQPQPRSAEPEATAHRPGRTRPPEPAPGPRPAAAGEGSAEPATRQPEGSAARHSAGGAGENPEGAAGEDAEGSAARDSAAGTGQGGSGSATRGTAGTAGQQRDASAGQGRDESALQGRAGAAAGGRPGGAGGDRAETTAGSAAEGAGRSTVDSTGGTSAGGDGGERAAVGDLAGSSEGGDAAAARRGHGDTPAAGRAAAGEAGGEAGTTAPTASGRRPGIPADRDKGDHANPTSGRDDTAVLRPSWAAADADASAGRDGGNRREPTGEHEDTTVLRPSWAAGAGAAGAASAAGAPGATSAAGAAGGPGVAARAGAAAQGGPAGGPSAGRPAAPATDLPRARLAADGGEDERPDQPHQPHQPHQPQQSERPKQSKRAKRTGWRRLVPTWRMVLGGFLTVVLLVIGAFFLGYSLVKIPPANALAMKQANVYLYEDGTEIARDGDINRENVTLAEVSKDAQHAVLAAEDRDFYTESAVDPKAMIRAGWNTATGKGKQSGSTITQQYVKNYYLGQEQTVTRKVKEFFIAIKLDRNEPKDKILEGYLNTSYFGRNAYGIQAAAQAYYGVKAKDLDPARAAYLAALVNAPSEYDVTAHPENKTAAVARWNYVLDGMVKKNWLSASERAGMKFPMPKEATVPTNMAGQRGYLVRAVKDYLAKNNILSEDELAAGGYRITTTLQKSKQDAFVKAVNDQVMSKLDKKNNPVDKYVRAGGAAVDPKTGEVVAMYGGIDYVKQFTNNATRRDFQVGSTFKPFVLTAAVQNHSDTADGRPITPNTIYDGTNKRPVQGWNGGYYAPENEDQRSYGNITVREATDKSVNAVYAQMAVDVGSDKVKDTAVALGVPSDAPELIGSPSIALGVAQASVLDMAEAYATLANHGKHGTYTIIKKITRDGADVVDLPERATSQAVSREAADTTTAVLRSVVQNGTGSPALAIGRPAAAKTGTAENDQAAWFAGYTPDLATVVSVMGQDPVTAAHKPLYGALGLARINGSGPPGSIWAQFMGDALKNTLASDFDLQLQPGADQTQPPPSSGAVETPGTGGQDDGGTTTGTDTGGQDTQGQGQGQGQTGGTTGDTTGTPGDATGGDTTGGTGTTGGTDTGTTTGGGVTGGSTPTTGGAGGSTPTTGGGTTGGTSPSGGTTGDGGTTTGTDTGTWGGQNPT